MLISNADSAEPDTVEGCDVGRLLKLYESQDKDLKDRFRAHVQWFCRASDVPANCLKDSDFVLDEDFEVIGLLPVKNLLIFQIWVVPKNLGT